MCGRTPPKAMVARIRVSSSSSPRMASCKWRGVIRLTLRSLAAFWGTKIASASTAWFQRSQAAAEQVLQCNTERDGGDKEVTHACELENLGSEILEDGGNVDGGLGANTHLVLGVCLEETLDTTAGELNVVEVSDQAITGREIE